MGGLLPVVVTGLVGNVIAWPKYGQHQNNHCRPLRSSWWIFCSLSISVSLSPVETPTTTAAPSCVTISGIATGTGPGMATGKHFLLLFFSEFSNLRWGLIRYFCEGLTEDGRQGLRTSPLFVQTLMNHSLTAVSLTHGSADLVETYLFETYLVECRAWKKWQGDRAVGLDLRTPFIVK